MTQNVQVPLKKAVTKEKVEEFLKTLRIQITLLWKKTRNTPTQISLFSLLLNS